jgi:hypothetical protein
LKILLRKKMIVNSELKITFQPCLSNFWLYI